jgi:hypothetical protein
MEAASANERIIRTQRGVFALGICVVPERLVATFRTTLDDMQGMDWVELPYSLARSTYDTIELYLMKNNIRTGGQKLIELDARPGEQGVLKLTQLGDVVMKKLSGNLAAKGKLQRGATPSTLVGIG